MRPAHHTDERGAALVELALVLPVLLLLILGVLDVGRALHYWQDGTHLAAEGARQAAVDQAPASGTLQASLLAKASTRELRSGGTGSMPAPATVCVDFPDGTSRVGDPVRVRATAQYHWLPFLRLAVTSTAITGEATMRLEAPPTTFSAGCT